MSQDLSEMPGYMPKLGSVFAEQYEIEKFLGAGGVGTVFVARHLSMDRQVALKIFSKRVLQDEAANRRFLRERQTMALLEHPHIVRALAAGISSDGLAYISQELILGESLDKLLEREQRLDPVAHALIFQDIFSALIFAHSKGVIHRDLKPSNIIVDELGQAKLVDFGLAKSLVQDEDKQPALTQTGISFGSPSYMSPEQAKGLNTDFRTDIYSLGVLLYRCLAGKELFDGETSMEVMYKHLNEKPPSLSPDTSASLNSVEINKVLLRALQKNPQERYQSIQDFSEDFLKAIGTKALWSQRLFKRLKRNIGLTALLAIICSISCVSLLSMMRKSHPLALPTVVKNNTDSGSINDRPVILLRDAFVTYRNAREGKNASSIKVRASLFAPSLRKIDQAVHELEIHPDAYLSFAAAFTNSRILGAARHELDHWDEKDRTKRQAALARDNESVLKYGLSKIKPNWKLEKALLECELGALYSEMHEIDNAREVFENVLLDWKTEPPSPCAEAQKYAGSFIGSVIGEPNYFKLGSLNSLAHIYEAEGSIKKAEATYKKTLEYVKAQHLSPAEPDVFRGLANYALFLHKHAQLAKSRSILAGLSQTLHDCNDDQWLLKGHQVLAEIYEQMNMKDNAEKEVNLAKRYVNAAGEPRDAFEAAHHRYQDTLK